MKIARFLILGAVFILLLSGCVSAKFLVPAWEPGTIAVLPFTNESSDVAIEKFTRVVMFDTLDRSGYEVVPLEQVDSSLEELGITEGGQLPTITIAEIAEKIEADSFMVGNIISARRVMLGVYFDKQFEANFQIYDRESEELKWEDERESQERKVVINPGEIAKTAGKAFALELASDAIYKLLDSHPLIEHIRNVVRTSVSTLP
jgi:hypothetical protein